MRIRYYGQPGHFICADRCRWHLHAHVGSYCISGVGEMAPRDDREEFEEVGSGRIYEIAVFNWKRRINRWSELRMVGANDRDKAVLEFERALRWAKHQVEKKS